MCGNIILAFSPCRNNAKYVEEWQGFSFCISVIMPAFLPYILISEKKAGSFIILKTCGVVKKMLNFFKIETKKYSCIKREVGTTLLKIEIFYPFLETDAENNPKVERINQFYEEIVNNCKIYAKGPLFEKIRLEYENDTDEKKRFHFKKYHYKVNFEYSITEDKMLSVVLDSLLLRGSERIRYRRTALVWDVSLSHLLLPIHKKGNTIASPHGYYIKDGKEILYTHDGGYREEKFDINM